MGAVDASGLRRATFAWCLSQRPFGNRRALTSRAVEGARGPADAEEVFPPLPRPMHVAGAAVLAAILGLAACDTVGTDGAPEPEVGIEVWDEMLAAVNDARAQGATCGDKPMPPAGPLIWDSRLDAAATAHSRDMADRRQMTHRGSDGSKVGDRVRAAGYEWRYVGENIARGQRSVAEVMDGWMESPSHCAQIMDPALDEIGAAEAEGYWTQVFGVPR